MCISAGELRCAACKIKSSIDSHIKGERHKERVREHTQRHAADTDLRKEMVTYYTENPDETNASVNPDNLVFRARVVQTLLAAGIPLTKADRLRPLLEQSGFRLSRCSHLAELIPKVEALEFKQLLAELEGQKISLSFDATTRLGEAVNIVARFCSSDFRLVQASNSFVSARC